MNNNNKTTIVVFWVEKGAPRAAIFPGEDGGAALVHGESLRRRAAAGEPLYHTCVSVDQPGNVTRAGANGELPHDRDWTQPSTVVFWMEEGAAQASAFCGKDIDPALSHCGVLHKRAASGVALSHLCMSTHLPGNVTQPGVNGTLPEGYDWTKRRSAHVGGRSVPVAAVSGTKSARAQVAGRGASPGIQACPAPGPVEVALRAEIDRTRQENDVLLRIAHGTGLMMQVANGRLREAGFEAIEMPALPDMPATASFVAQTPAEPRP